MTIDLNTTNPLTFLEWKGYYEDGRLMEEGNFKIGEKVGLWKYYNQNGQLKIKEYLK